MVVKAKVEPLDRDVEVIFREELSDDARAQILREFAEEQIAEARSMMGAGGRDVPYEIIVDGKKGASLASIKADSTIVVNFFLIGEVLEFIQRQLQMHSPVLTGLYAKSHELFADGIDTENPNNPPPAEEYFFTNIQPYARKIERGLSKQASKVYEVVAELAKSRYSNVARISFSYRTVVGGMMIGGKAGDRSDLRNPAIVVKEY